MGKKIYVADDVCSVRDSLFSTLGDEGHNVTCFADGSELVEAYKSVRPDMVITDKDMLKMSGMDVIKYIRETAGDAETPIILITGLPTREVQDYISATPRAKMLIKPLELKDLLKAVSESLG